MKKYFFILRITLGLYSTITFGRFKKLMDQDTRFISVERLLPSAIKYTALDQKHYFCFPAFPLERESLCEGKQPIEIEGSFQGTFVIELENAKVFGTNGYVLLRSNNDEQKFLLNTLWDWEDTNNIVFKEDFKFPPSKKIKAVSP